MRLAVHGDSAENRPVKSQIDKSQFQGEQAG
jgi:hypothetical protein